jgi:ketosteroid isomerase-like protein
MAHPNADLVREGFEAFNTGDMATLNQLIADDAVWHTPGRHPLAGDFKGKEAILGSFAQLAQTVDSFEQEIHAVLADDEHTVVLANATVTRGGKTVTGQQVGVFHIVDGKATEVWFASTDPYAFDELFAD